MVEGVAVGPRRGLAQNPVPLTTPADRPPTVTLRVPRHVPSQTTGPSVSDYHGGERRVHKVAAYLPVCLKTSLTLLIRVPKPL